MTFEQAQSAVADSLKVAGSQEDWSAGTGWAEFAAPYRPGSPFWGAALDVYFDGPVGLACVAVNALRGPQVTLDGIELVGRTPSRVEERFIDYADRRAWSCGIRSSSTPARPSWDWCCERNVLGTSC
jgi:hypothetical protein